MHLVSHYVSGSLREHQTFSTLKRRSNTQGTYVILISERDLDQEGLSWKHAYLEDQKRVHDVERTSDRHRLSRRAGVVEVTVRLLDVGRQLNPLVLENEHVALDKLIELLGNLWRAGGRGRRVAAAVWRRNQLLVGLIGDRK